MGRAPEAAAGQPIEHVAEVADQQVRIGRRVGPFAADVHFEPWRAVGGEQGEESVVGVLGDAPRRRIAERLWRVAEDPEQRGRCRGESVGEERGRSSEADRHQRQQMLAEGLHACSPFEDAQPKACWASGPDVGAVHRPRIRWELGAEVVPLLAVGYPRRELAFEREPASPRPAAVPHRDQHLLRVRECEELRCGADQFVSRAAQVVGERDAEEAHLATGAIDRRAGVTLGRVDDRELHSRPA